MEVVSTQHTVALFITFVLAKIVSQFSNTPHTQLSEDLIEAAYLVSMQEEQRRTYADTNANMQQ